MCIASRPGWQSLFRHEQIIMKKRTDSAHCQQQWLARVNTIAWHNQEKCARLVGIVSINIAHVASINFDPSRENYSRKKWKKIQKRNHVINNKIRSRLPFFLPACAAVFAFSVRSHARAVQSYQQNEIFFIFFCLFLLVHGFDSISQFTKYSPFSLLFVFFLSVVARC